MITERKMFLAYLNKLIELEAKKYLCEQMIASCESQASHLAIPAKIDSSDSSSSILSAPFAALAIMKVPVTIAVIWLILCINSDVHMAVIPLCIVLAITLVISVGIIFIELKNTQKELDQTWQDNERIGNEKRRIDDLVKKCKEKQNTIEMLCSSLYEEYCDSDEFYIYPKYRTLSALSQIYDYLDSGICDTLISNV